MLVRSHRHLLAAVGYLENEWAATNTVVWKQEGKWSERLGQLGMSLDEQLGRSRHSVTQGRKIKHNHDPTATIRAEEVLTSDQE